MEQIEDEITSVQTLKDEIDGCVTYAKNRALIRMGACVALVAAGFALTGPTSQAAFTLAAAASLLGVWSIVEMQVARMTMVLVGYHDVIAPRDPVLEYQHRVIADELLAEEEIERGRRLWEEAASSAEARVAMSGGQDG